MGENALYEVLDIGDVLIQHFQSNPKSFNYSHGQFTEYFLVKYG